MGPLVTRALSLMQEYGLRLTPDELFGKEIGQPHHQKSGGGRKAIPYGASLWEARSEVIDPGYAAKCAAFQPPQERAGGKSGFGKSFKEMVAAEARAAKKAAAHGGKWAAVEKVADKHNVNVGTVHDWLKKH